MPSPRIIASNASMLGTSNSDTIVQYCSAQKSVMTRILPSPAFSLSLDIARNLSTIGRTLPGLQYMISRMSSISSPRVGGVYHGQPCSGGQRCEKAAILLSVSYLTEEYKRCQQRNPPPALPPNKVAGVIH